MVAEGEEPRPIGRIDRGGPVPPRPPLKIATDICFCFPPVYGTCFQFCCFLAVYDCLSLYCWTCDTVVAFSIPLGVSPHSLLPCTVAYKSVLPRQLGLSSIHSAGLLANEYGAEFLRHVVPSVCNSEGTFKSSDIIGNRFSIGLA